MASLLGKKGMVGYCLGYTTYLMIWLVTRMNIQQDGLFLHMCTVCVNFLVLALNFM